MHDRFEKEVQNKMEELRLTPSSPVWEKIEMEIKPEKKRRRVIFWLCFGTLLLGGSSYLAFELSKDNVQRTTQHASAPIEKTSSGKNFSSAEGAPQSETTLPKTNRPQNEIKELQMKVPGDMQVDIAGRQRQTVKEQIPGEKHNERKWIKRQKDHVQMGGRETLLPSVDEKEKKASETEKDPGTAMSGKDVAEIQPFTTIDSIVVKETSTGVLDSLAKPDINREIAPPVSADSILKKKVASNKKWKQQFIFGVGRSSYQAGIPLLSNSSPRFDSQPQNTGSIGSSGGFYRPAETTGGLSLSAGYALSKKLSEHWEVSFGLQYTYYSTKTIVGNKSQNDTLIQNSSGGFSNSAYYTNYGNKTYANHFHVVDLPVVISYKPFITVPVYVSLGAAYGRLLYTNALTFSNRSNIYYHDEEAYTHNLLPITSSVQVELFAKKKVSLRIGPAVQYNLIKLRKENRDAPPHLFFAGLRGGIIF